MLSFLCIGVIKPSDHELGYMPLRKIMLNNFSNKGEIKPNEHLNISARRPSIPGLLSDFNDEITSLSSDCNMALSSVELQF